jgi:hypothetical protein
VISPGTSAVASTPIYAPAAGHLRWHHAIQLPGHGVAVDAADNARLRKLLYHRAIGRNPPECLCNVRNPWDETVAACLPKQSDPLG